jgi:hypothetical protein
MPCVTGATNYKKEVPLEIVHEVLPTWSYRQQVANEYKQHSGEDVLCDHLE